MVTLRARTFVPVAVAFFLSVVMGAPPGHAACDPTTDPDKTDIANARAAVAANCNCSTAANPYPPNLKHGAYVSCARQQADLTLVNKSCAQAVRRCASRSICGKEAVAVTCCVTGTTGTKCKIKPNAAHCTAPPGSTACIGTYTSCCDACATGGCAPPTTSTTTTTLPCGGCAPGFDCLAYLTIEPFTLLNQPQACFPAGTTTCTAGIAFPTCGGACPAGMTCGPFRVTISQLPLQIIDACACTDSSSQCKTDPSTGFCLSVGLCPAGLVCDVSAVSVNQCAGCFPPM